MNQNKHVEITIEQFRKAIDRALDHAMEFGLANLSAGDIDEYWLINEAERFNHHSIPHPSVGSYVHDISEIRELAIHDDRPPMVLDLDHIGNLFQLLSHRLLPLNNDG